MKNIHHTLAFLPLVASSPVRSHNDAQDVNLDLPLVQLHNALFARAPAIPSEALQSSASTSSVPGPPTWLEYVMMWMTCGPGPISCTGSNTTCASDLRCEQPEIFKNYPEFFQPVSDDDTAPSKPELRPSVVATSTPLETTTTLLADLPLAKAPLPVTTTSMSRISSLVTFLPSATTALAASPGPAHSNAPLRPQKPHILPPQPGDMMALTGPQLMGWGSTIAREGEAQNACPLKKCTSPGSCGKNAKCLRDYCACRPNYKSLSTVSGKTMLLPNLAAVFVSPGVACNSTCAKKNCAEVPTAPVKGCLNNEAGGHRGEGGQKWPRPPKKGAEGGGAASVHQYDQLGKPMEGHGAVNQPGPVRLL